MEPTTTTHGTRFTLGDRGGDAVERAVQAEPEVLVRRALVLELAVLIGPPQVRQILEVELRWDERLWRRGLERDLESQRPEHVTVEQQDEVGGLAAGESGAVQHLEAA